MPVRIEVTTTVPDSRADIRKKKFFSAGFAKVQDVSIVDVYTIDKSFSTTELTKIGDALINPVTQTFRVKGKGVRGKTKENKSTSPLTLHPSPFSFAVEIGFLPGVTDNVGHTAKEIIEDLLKVKFKNGEN